MLLFVSIICAGIFLSLFRCTSNGLLWLAAISVTTAILALAFPNSLISQMVHTLLHR